MDFQLARNLSALSRAQQEAAQALLHIDSLLDCINREIIMSAASSEATEQLVTSARATLMQVQDMLATQSDEGARRLREAQVSFIITRRALLVTDIPSREPPYEAAYGVMIGRDESEWVSFNSVQGFTVGDLWRPVLRVPNSCRFH